MCGVTGLWAPTAAPDETERRVLAMGEVLRARGPDAGGTYRDDRSGLVLGHRRLSIVDLSENGAQPMRSRSGRFVTAYNGEIYNFPELRTELEALGHAFRGGSDTEVALAAFEAWGIERATGRFAGMFALAVWDTAERRLHLIRDRLGVKPLVWARTGRGLAFASELRPIAALGDFDRTIDRGALAAYLRRSAVPAPHTIYAAAKKVRPGTFLTFDGPMAEPRETVYWSALDVARSGLARPFRGDERDAVDAIEASLREAIRGRMIADVPLGAFLSGGIDSSTVVALMQELSTSRVRTYSIGNESADYDESGPARAVARHLGTEHTEHVVTADDAMAVLRDLPATFDEPFGDSSQIPTFLVARLARREVTVALSGDGGDEVFGGYNRHVWGPPIWRLLSGVPRSARTGIGRAIGRVSTDRWDAVLGALRAPVRTPGAKAHKLAAVMGAESVDDLHRRLASHWPDPTRVVLGASVEAEPAALADRLTEGDPAERMMWNDLVAYLPDDVLTKVDRATMAVSLEAREPLLDHRLIELAWTMPRRLRVGREGKHLLREVLRRRVPAALWERPKMGFGVPIGAWLRGPLRRWAEALLDEERLSREGFFDPAPIRSRWEAHLRGEGEHAHHLWDVVAFQRWREGAGSVGRD